MFQLLCMGLPDPVDFPFQAGLLPGDGVPVLLHLLEFPPRRPDPQGEKRAGDHRKAEPDGQEIGKEA